MEAALVTVTGGLRRDYIGMRNDNSEHRKVIFTMYDYINEILESLPEDTKGTSEIPARSHIFKADDTDTDKIRKTTAGLYHHYAAQLLFLSKHARSNLQTALAFLCTIVQEPDTGDYKKRTCK